MNVPAPTELILQVSADGATDEEIDRMTRQLLGMLRDAEVESVALLRAGEIPTGSKGDPVTLGSIAVQVLPSLLPGVLGLVQAWANRGKGRTVKFKANGIEFEGPPEEYRHLLEKLGIGRGEA